MFSFTGYIVAICGNDNYNNTDGSSGGVRSSLYDFVLTFSEKGSSPRAARGNSWHSWREGDRVDPAGQPARGSRYRPGRYRRTLRRYSLRSAAEETTRPTRPDHARALCSRAT
ncbi:hypothetical protein Bbelb_244480 [Branchiostoma belcheri]|nr:hypothetical protein Bbelb_244480 [Branchiostoma belcheri]